MGQVLLLAALLAVPDTAARQIAARFTEIPPLIDGIIEETWLASDMAREFIQFVPDNGRPSSEATTACLLYDKHNLYVAFRCPVRDPKELQAHLSATSDGVRLFLDTYDDDASCYAFSVSAAGIEATYRMTSDGNWIEQWEGVWRSRAKVENWGYAVEIAIPFKTLRYQPGSTSWGIDFGRYIAARGEKSYWCRHSPTSVKVSEMGWLRDIRPPAPGLHLEAYPVGLVRFERDPDSRVWPGAGFDLAWLPNPTANVQLTTFPDFAEIEADPYRVNLSKYEMTLAERRPFFIEASENFGTGLQSIRLFYSRRIGKRLPDGTEVPIFAGLKYTDRLGRYTLGALGALTGSADDTEPASIYSVASLRRGFLRNSEMGLLYAGKDNSFFSNHGGALDAALRFGDFSATGVIAGSQLGESLGTAGLVRTEYLSSKMTGRLLLTEVGDSFDMNGIGYTGWRGTSASIEIGPDVYGAGPFQNAGLHGNAELTHDADYPEDAWDWNGGGSAFSRFQNRMSLNLWAGAKRSRFRDTAGAWHEFDGANAGLSFGTDETRAVSFYCWGEHLFRSYNYHRRVLAPSTSSGIEVWARAGDNLGFGAEAEATAEFGENGTHIPKKDLTIALRPLIDWAFTPKLTLALVNETVRSYDLRRDRPLYSYYLSLLWSWTVRPRSTLHVALNQRLASVPEALENAGTIAVVKLRYLFVF